MISTSPFFSSTEQNVSSNHEKCARRSQIQSVIIITTVDLLLRAFVVSVFVVKKTSLKRSLFCLPFEERTKGQTARNFFLSETNTNTGRNTRKKKKKKKERKDDAREEAVVVVAETERRVKLGPTEMWTTWDWCCIFCEDILVLFEYSYFTAFLGFQNFLILRQEKFTKNRAKNHLIDLFTRVP